MVVRHLQRLWQVYPTGAKMTKTPIINPTITVAFVILAIIVSTLLNLSTVIASTLVVIYCHLLRLRARAKWKSARSDCSIWTCNIILVKFAAVNFQVTTLFTNIASSVIQMPTTQLLLMLVSMLQRRSMMKNNDSSSSSSRNRNKRVRVMVHPGRRHEIFVLGSSWRALNRRTTMMSIDFWTCWKW